MAIKIHKNLRNVAIVAHVDHGKTTLVDAMLRHNQLLRDDQRIGDLIMDSDPQEKERGITILAKNTAIQYNGVKLNIIDTPGHVDFSGEVERVVNMADGCLLLVDAIDGPMSQTRYVLNIAMQKGLRPIFVINKIDRETERVGDIVNEIQDLLLETAVTADQLDCPVLYASARDGYAIRDLADPRNDMGPLFDAILEYIPGPSGDSEGDLQLLVASLDYDNHLGQIAVGRIFRGSVEKGMPVAVIGQEGQDLDSKIEYLFTFKDLNRTPVNQARTGDIIAVAGMAEVTIGDTIASIDNPEPIERISIADPVVTMRFGVNTSPFAGRDGQYATSRVLWERLQREIRTNVSLQISRTESSDEFLVAGRGELHLSVLIENLRRDGLEFQVSRPEAIIRSIEGKKCEPYELVTIDTKQEFVGALTEELAQRLGVLTEIKNDNETGVRICYKIPTRGLIGFRGTFLRLVRGEGVMTNEFLEFQPMGGPMKSFRTGSMVASENGVAISYGIRNAQQHGQTLLPPQTPIYGGMIVGIHSRNDDLNVNICKERKMTNMRSSTSEIVERLEPPLKLELEEAVSFIASDELIEVTPKNIRLRKQILNAQERYRSTRSR